MSAPHRFHQVDVFTAVPLAGNPLAVVHDAMALDDARMAAFARWTHLSETTFLLPPTDPGADYRVRIFTPLRAALRISPDAVLRHQWVDNGPGWVAVQLHSAQAVRAVVPDGSAIGDLKIGVVGAWNSVDQDPSQEQPSFEVRAFFGTLEDPVTGSLNAGIAQWLIGAGYAPDRYVAGQGHALGRDGRVYIQHERSTEGHTIWVGGDVAPVVEGTVLI